MRISPRRRAASLTKPQNGRAFIEAAKGASWGVVFAVGALALFGNLIPGLMTYRLVPLMAVVGGGLALTRFRGVMAGLNVGLAALILLVGATPLSYRLIRGLERSDPLSPASAIVVLSSGFHRNRTLTASFQARLIHGYELLGEGYAPVLVTTEMSRPSVYPQHRIVERQMAALGMKRPLVVVAGVENTHDEARAVARLAQTKGWKRVILVTQPHHMKRAAQVFEKAGLSVIASPCAEGEYEWPRPIGFGDRIKAFRDGAHEIVGLWVYRMRGWV